MSRRYQEHFLFRKVVGSAPSIGATVSVFAKYQPALPANSWQQMRPQVGNGAACRGNRQASDSVSSAGSTVFDQKAVSTMQYPRPSPAIAPMTDICPSSHAENKALMPSDGAPAGCTYAPCTCSQWLGPHQIRRKRRKHRGARTSVQNAPHMLNERCDAQQPPPTPGRVKRSEEESRPPGVVEQRPSALRCRRLL